MKLFTMISILIICNFALAENPEELAKRGCIPRRDATTGEVSSYVCNVTIRELKNLNDIISKNDLSAQTDLSTLLAQITLKPARDPKTGKSLFQVTKIEKGSAWEKSGLKVGDLVTK